MLRTGLTAAGLTLAAVVLVAGGRAEPARTAHRCGAQDRQFVHQAELSSQSLTVIGQDYQSGATTVKQAIAATRDAETGIENTSPQDPSLKVARSLMRGMMLEYQRALRAQSRGKGNASAHMYRSYSLAAYARQVLVDAAPALDGLGCPLTQLLQE
jgi:hypothetical protein